MSSQSTPIVQRIWNYCHVLRDDGVSYGDYLEQLTYPLFLKMDDERVREFPWLPNPCGSPGSQTQFGTQQNAGSPSPLGGAVHSPPDSGDNRARMWYDAL